MIAPDIVRLSPNINLLPMPAGIKTVIIHCTRSGHSMNPTEFQGTLNYMATPGTTSSHWVVARDGTKARVVPDDRQAWHAGVDNDNAWGIEIEQGAEGDGFTDVQMAAVVDICKGYRDDFGVPVRHVFDSHSGGFVGHEETEQGRSYGKTDPGNLYPWDWFIEELVAEPVHAQVPFGIGVHYTDGTDEEVWDHGQNSAAMKTADGIGIRFSDGTVRTVWPP